MTKSFASSYDHRRSRISVVFIIGIIFWLLSSTYQGPAYLTDEIGYLTKAAAIAGFSVDGASSYHGGYSFFLAPLFLIFKSPFAIWQGIMVLNSLFWCCTFLLLLKLSDNLFPEVSESEKKTALIITAFYPACISMCGYAFVSSILAPF